MIITGDLDKSNKVIVEFEEEDLKFVDNIVTSIYKDGSKYEAATILGLRDRIIAGYVAERVFDKYLVEEDKMLIILADILGVYENTLSLYMTYNHLLKLRLHGIVYN